MNLKLNIWRQKDSNDKGGFKTYQVNDVSPDMSFLEMIDVLNEDLVKKGEEPVHFDHDCREGICGTCSMVINGRPHGPKQGITTCQLHMRSFSDGDEITIEPWRARAFPVIKDLIVDRSAFDRIIRAGGFVSVNTGGAPDANVRMLRPCSLPGAPAQSGKDDLANGSRRIWRLYQHRSLRGRMPQRD